MGRFLDSVTAAGGPALADYDAAWRWSVDDPGAFWQAVWDVAGVQSSTPTGPALADARMPGARWFPGATLNYASHALALPDREGTDIVVVGRSQSRGPVDLTADELRDAVARCRAGLQRAGVRRGDRVAAFLPTIPETLVAFLATASLGATWSSCAPEFGTRAVVDRFGQIEPVVLLTVDGYRYGDRDIDRATEVAELRAALPTVRTTVVVPYLRDEAGALAAVPGAIAWSELLSESGPLAFEPVPFDHPLYVLFSSGTTGLPKAIVHGHGGILLEHWKALALHTDLGPTDRFCWFTTTGWMMWNYLVSGLLAGSTVVLFDGNPAWPDLSTLWRLASDERVTYLGLSAPFLMACRAAGLTPGATRRWTWAHCGGSGRRAPRCRRPASGGSATPCRTPSRSARCPAGRTCARASSGRRRSSRSGRARSAAGCSARGSRRSIPTGGRSSARPASS